MRAIYTSFTIILFSISAFAQATVYTDSRDRKQLLGPIEIQDLKSEPFNEWYEKVYNRSEIDPGTIEKLNKYYDEDITVEIYLGTWCGDSKRQVPKFLKIVEQSKIKEEDVKIICLDNRGTKSKQGPNREEKGKNIHRVPTFIFYKNNEEVGRIVESPINTMEIDIAQIHAGLPTEPNYLVTNYVAHHLNEAEDLSTIDSTFAQYPRYFKKRITGEGELNTLGYLLMAAGEIEKAKVAFRCNVQLFPDSGNVYDSLAEAQMRNKEYDKAVTNYMKSYQLDPSNEEAIKKVNQIRKESGAN